MNITCLCDDIALQPGRPPFDSSLSQAIIMNPRTMTNTLLMSGVPNRCTYIPATLLQISTRQNRRISPSIFDKQTSWGHQGGPSLKCWMKRSFQSGNCWDSKKLTSFSEILNLSSSSVGRYILSLSSMSSPTSLNTFVSWFAIPRLNAALYTGSKGPLYESAMPMTAVEASPTVPATLQGVDLDSVISICLVFPCFLV